MLFIYRTFFFFLFPFFLIFTYIRLFLNKEHKIRFKEKIYSSNFRVNKNKNKKLVWFHCSSIGEFLSVYPLISKINNSNKDLEFLITSTTLSSANLIEKKFIQHDNIMHRFFPLDIEYLSENFLNAWKPNMACFVDSEIWPNFLFKIKEKKIPLMLLNGRITKKTFNRWKVFFNFARKTFNNFDLCLASSKESEDNLKKLQVKNLKYLGNLKFSFNNNTENIDLYNKKILDNFKVWCAASTHEGEELIAIKTHMKIREKYSNILTIIIPRHVNRSFDLKKLSNKFKLRSQILNEKDKIHSDTEILIINSFGVVSKYFNYCKNAFIGKSFVKGLKLGGGQNPIEAAKAGCKIFHGPYVYNFKEIYDLLQSYGISEKLNDGSELAKKLIENLEKPKEINKQTVYLLDNYGENVLNQTIEELNKFMKLKYQNA